MSRCPEGGTGAAALRPQWRSQELISKPLRQTAVLSPGGFCWQNAFCDDIQSTPAERQHELVVWWQSLAKAEPGQGRAADSPAGFWGAKKQVWDCRGH